MSPLLYVVFAAFALLGVCVVLVIHVLDWRAP